MHAKANLKIWICKTCHPFHMPRPLSGSLPIPCSYVTQIQPTRSQCIVYNFQVIRSRVNATGVVRIFLVGRGFLVGHRFTISSEKCLVKRATSKLPNIYHFIGDNTHTYEHRTKQDIVITQLRICHTKDPKPHILSRGPPIACHHCGQTLTIDHMLLECAVFETIPETCIVEVLRKAGFFYLIWCNLLTSTSPETWAIWSVLSNLFGEWKQLWNTFTCIGRLICPQGRVSLNKSNPTKPNKQIIIVSPYLALDYPSILFKPVNLCGFSCSGWQAIAVPVGAAAVIWVPSQYPKRRLIVRSREASKPRNWYFKLSYRFEILQAHRQQCCRIACQISERSDNSKYKSRDFMRSCDKTSFRILKRVAGQPSIFKYQQLGIWK